MDKKYNDGGLATDGMSVDPVSGNDIPLGSNAEDVRDDVDAKLSSGEYVVPADVVKYVGVAQLEKLVTKAKSGLEDMDENGRIGGEPVGEAEEVVMTLGGDLGSLDGYATGGMVPGTDIDGIINRVKAAAMKDPSIINMLKAKGIFIQEPQPQGQEQQSAMAQGAVPKQAAPPAVQGQTATAGFSDGGLATGNEYSTYNPNDYQSEFNPYAHTMGFSGESNVTGQMPGTIPVPGQGLTQECPEGSTWDPATNACVPVESTIPVDDGSGNMDNNEDYGGPAKKAQDPNSWMNQYDYSNPETLVSQTMSTMGIDDPNAAPKRVGIVESLTNGLLGNLGGGLVGKAMAIGNVAAANANAIILENKGMSEEANKIRAQVAVYEKSKGISGWPTAMREGTGMAERAEKSKHAAAIGNWGSKNAAVGSGGGGGKPAVNSPTPNTGSGITADNNQNDGGNSSSGLDNHAEISSNAQAQGATAGQAGSIAAKSVTKNVSDKDKEGSADMDGAYGISGLNKGGFIAPRPKKDKAPMAKNKKGLGRK